MQRIALVGDAGKMMILLDGSRANTTITDGITTRSERANIVTFRIQG